MGIILHGMECINALILKSIFLSSGEAIVTFENPFWILPISEKYGEVWGSEGGGSQLLSQMMDSIREWHIQMVIKSDDFYPHFWRLYIYFTIYPPLLMPLGNHFTIGLGHFFLFFHIYSTSSITYQNCQIINHLSWSP